MADKLDALLQELCAAEWLIASYQQAGRASTIVGPFGETFLGKDFRDNDARVLNRGYFFWEPAEEIVKRQFGKISYRPGTAYLILEQCDSANGRLFSFGFSHSDVVGRPNPHIIYIISNYTLLNQFLDAVTKNINNLDRLAFVHETEEVNVFAKLKKLHLLKPSSAQITLEINKQFDWATGWPTRRS